MDWGAFKTPTLRDVARTAPYIHDGSLKTLDEVVEFHDKGGKPNKNLDEKIKPLKLTDADKKDLVEFLRSLNGDGWQKVTAPTSFPQ
jgi:cytochrome c peroxidase